MAPPSYSLELYLFVVRGVIFYYELWLKSYLPYEAVGPPFFETINDGAVGGPEP